MKWKSWPLYWLNMFPEMLKELLAEGWEISGYSEFDRQGIPKYVEFRKETRGAA